MEARLLRARGLGQCDLVRLYDGALEIREVKGPGGQISPTQWRRQREAASFLAAVFDRGVRLGVEQVCKPPGSPLT